MIRLATEDLVPVSADDWYQRRRRDAEGEFFRKVADQGPRKGVGGSTRQGIYVLSAGGKLLSFKNAQDADVMLDAVKLGLKRFKALPAAEREPGAVTVPEPGKLDAAYTRKPPDGGLIVRVYTRILERDADKGYVPGTCDFTGGDKAARDHLWLTAAERGSLVPDRPMIGDVASLPRAVVDRIARFHLVDNTRGEPNYWRADEVRKAELNATVTKADDNVIEMTLSGSAQMTTADGKRGYEPALAGRIVYDRKAKALTAFDVLAAGDHWGRSPFTPGDRPGKKPLGLVFELVKGDRPDQRVPPQASREASAYFGRP